MTLKTTVSQQTNKNYPEKQVRLLGALFFISTIVLVGQLAMVDYLESTRMTEIAMILLRCVAIVAGITYVSYRGKIIIALRKHVQTKEKIIAIICALAASFGITRWFADALLDFSEQGDVRLGLIDALVPRAAAIVMLILIGLLAAFALYVLLALLVRIIREALREQDAFRFTRKPVREKRAYVWITAIVLAFISTVVCVFTIDKGQNWGPDFALYIKQAISIAEGRFSEIYVAWGYSAILSIVYRLVGFDTITFSTLIYYKIPAIICMAAAVVTLQFYFNRRFSLKWATALTFVFAVNPMLIELTNSIISNIPHLLFSMLSILCMYRLFASQKRKEQIVYGLMVGVFIWCSDVIRANGVVLLLALLCMHAVALLARLFRKNRVMSELGEQTRVGFLPAHVLPYVVFLILWGVTSLILPDKGTEVSLLERATLASVWSNIVYYKTTLTTFIWSITRSSLPFYSLAWLWVPLMVIGIKQSLKRDLLSCIYFGGTLLLLFLLVFRQGVRYLLPVLPMLVLFIAIGIQSVAMAAKKLFGTARFDKVLVWLAVAFIVLNLGWAAASGARTNMENNRVFDAMSYSEDAKDVYRYIQENTEDDAVIAFNKPRVVAVNTNRVSFNDISLADDGLPVYLLITEDEYAEHQVIDEFDSISDIAEFYDVGLTKVYENPRFQLYMVTDTTDPDN